MEKPSVLIAPEMTVSYQCESIETESVTVPFTVGLFQVKTGKFLFACKGSGLDDYA